jgi:hypothetical protein
MEKQFTSLILSLRHPEWDINHLEVLCVDFLKYALLDLKYEMENFPNTLEKVIYLDS